MAQCTSCDNGLQNTGLVFGSKTPQVAKKILFIPLVAGDGSTNGIDVSGSTAIDLTTYTNEADPKKRIYPNFGIIEQLTDEREEAIKQTFDSGNVAYVRDGNLPITFMLPNVPPSYKKKIDALGCGKLGFYYVDNCGCVVGGKVVNNVLLPIPVMDYSLDSRFVRAGYETVAMLAVNFMVDNKFNDGDLTMLDCADISGDALRLEGLINLDGAVSEQSTPTPGDAVFNLTVTTDYGSARSKQPVTGLVASNFRAVGINSQSGDTFTVESANEISPGVYVVEILNNTGTGTNARIGIATATKGFDDTLLFANAVVAESV